MEADLGSISSWQPVEIDKLNAAFFEYLAGFTRGEDLQFDFSGSEQTSINTGQIGIVVTRMAYKLKGTFRHTLDKLVEKFLIENSGDCNSHRPIRSAQAGRAHHLLERFVPSTQ